MPLAVLHLEYLFPFLYQSVNSASAEFPEGKTAGGRSQARPQSCKHLQDLAEHVAVGQGFTHLCEADEGRETLPGVAAPPQCGT